MEKAMLLDIPDVLLLSEEAHDFFNTDLGKHVLKRSASESKAAVDELIDCNPDDAQRIRTLQNRVFVATAAVGWLNDVLQDGLNVERAIGEIDDSDPDSTEIHRGWV